MPPAPPCANLTVVVALALPLPVVEFSQAIVTRPSSTPNDEFCTNTCGVPFVNAARSIAPPAAVPGTICAAPAPAARRAAQTLEVDGWPCTNDANATYTSPRLTAAFTWRGNSVGAGARAGAAVNEVSPGARRAIRT